MAFGPNKAKLPTKLRGIFGGCGSLLNHPLMAPHVIALTGKPIRDVTLVYLGTASYDLPEKCQSQTSWYSENGCTVISLDVVLKAPSTVYMEECIDKADIILVSGGNTSFAMRRWKRLGLDVMMRKACLGPRRVVMAGGSAGAICWWSGGHSDSMDPDSFKEAKLSSHGSEHDIDEEDGKTDTATTDEDDVPKEWDYIRVDGLGFIPGLCCPHHDRIQSNGILRATDFDAMLLRHPTEVGICIDHNAAFMIDNANYRVLYPDGLEGSLMPNGSFSEDRLGKPCVWVKEVSDDGKSVIRTLCPDNGKLSDLLRIPEQIFQSIRHMKLAAKENPDDGPMRMSYPGFAAKSFFGGIVAKEFFDVKNHDMSEGDEDEEERNN
eukprot:CCRYP_017637-RA/>CCRYP_017637-RA protein AED:0.09 eAED:0.09 QI:248/1/1/1/0.75/0.6/5/471/377